MIKNKNELIDYDKKRKTPQNVNSVQYMVTQIINSNPNLSKEGIRKILIQKIKNKEISIKKGSIYNIVNRSMEYAKKQNKNEKLE
ncbi:MAG: hypothetical protein GY870_08370, partial [archaeon]|nr:hypothetical protein [archaeon]